MTDLGLERELHHTQERLRQAEAALKLARNDALEEAAMLVDKVAEEMWCDGEDAALASAAAAIRKLKA